MRYEPFPTDGFCGGTSAMAHHIGVVLHDFSSGGSERIAIRLANRWAAAGRRVTLFVGHGQGPARTLVAAAVDIKEVSPAVRRSWLSRPILGYRLGPIIRDTRPDLLFIPGNFHMSVAATLAARLGPQRPAVVCKLSNPLDRPDRSRVAQAIYEMLVRRQARQIDRFVAMAPSLAHQAQAILGRRTIATIPEPNIDEDQAAVQRPPHRGPYRLICAGRLVQQKNFELALRSFALVDRNFDVELVIYGEGPLRDALERRAAELGLEERVLFGGHVPDLKPLLAQADLFLMTSRYEGYPAVAVEALVAGVPVVSTLCSPAMADIIRSEDDGSIVEAEPRAIARMIERYLRSGPTVSSSQWLVQQHRADAVAAAYLALFDEEVGLAGV